MKLTNFEILWKNQGNNIRIFFFPNEDQEPKNKMPVFNLQRWIVGMWLQMNEYNGQRSSFNCASLTKMAHIL